MLLAGCAAEQRTSGEDALARELAGRVAGEPQRCVPTTSGSGGLQAIDGNTLVYRQGNRVWVNRVQGCSNLDRDSILIVETFGSQYCRNDRVRELERGSTIPGAVCILQNFVPYTRS